MNLFLNIISAALLVLISSCGYQGMLVHNEKIELQKMDLVIRPVIPTNSPTCGFSYIPEFQTKVKSFVVLDKNKKITPAKMMGGETPIICNLIYPELAKRSGVEGTVELELEVDKKGYPQNIIITKAIGGGCDENTVKAVHYSFYYPAKLNNKRINTKYKLCIQFLFPEEIKNVVDWRPLEFSNHFLKLRGTL